ncbi:MAG: 4-alpha-glucanotransferase [Firmicutes bacterium ADurb.Bin182]|nr:MAG: 4-alpha-glucanotransferase [Firmicutes bacterium ADurb.Bin182]
MHISSLPSPYGIGTFGKAAFEFADFLCSAGQKYWQMLPLSPSGFGDSPYQSFSVFAGNPLFIDPELLIEDSLLTKWEAQDFDCSGDSRYVDYGSLIQKRPFILRAAFSRGYSRYREEIEAFKSDNSHWLFDYALFMAVKSRFGMRSWQDWEDEAIKRREKDALGICLRELSEEIDYCVFCQYLFFKQWSRLKNYIASKGISVIGDIPVYPALDSADVWAHPELFALDRDFKPEFVAGVPPDYFSKTGQLWGNPLYDWERMGKNGFAWWMERIKGSRKIYDVIRLDHFRGLSEYWAVPFGEKTAENGEWKQGPGKRFIDALKAHFPELDVIAEDLGYMTEEVRGLLKYSGYPGMKVLQFAFDPKEPGDHLPHNLTKNTVLYTGTHDNETLKGFIKSSSDATLRYIQEYLCVSRKEDIVWGILRAGMSSVSDLFIAQMQDYLELDNDSRMNTPSVPCGNWKWRMTSLKAASDLSGRIRRMTELYGRLNDWGKSFETNQKSGR